MIKNILYSLFLHLIVATLIYINFRIVKKEIIEIDRGISVGFADFTNNKEVVPEVKKEEKPQEKKPPKKIKEKKKVAAKKKEIKSKSKKTEKPKEIDKKPEFKENLPEEKMQEKIDEEEKLIDDKKDEEEKIDKNEESETKAPEEPKNTQKFYQSDEVIDDIEQINLSAREKFNIKTQFTACLSRALAGQENIGIMLIINIKISPDGVINYDFDKNFDVARYENKSEKKYIQAVDNAVKALELCSPMRNLPADKYDIWREFSIRFNQ